MSTDTAPAFRATPPGCFFIPAIDAAVPVNFSQDVSRAQILARFATAAAAAGVPIPVGGFLSIEEVVTAQWQQWFERGFPPHAFRGLVGAPVIRVTDEELQVVITATSNLDVFRLKPVIEGLEKTLPGLGWFVHSVLNLASYHAHEMYDMSRASYMMDSNYWDMDEFSDEAYARSVIMNEGQDPPEGPIPPETMERLRADYSFWPSDILAEVDGHAHLLGHLPAPDYVKPPKLSLTKVKTWLRGNRRHQHAKLVDVALELRAMCERDKERVFVWDGTEDETETLGAMCFIAWDVPDFLLEAVSHYEQNQYNGGQAVEAFARTTLALDEKVTDADIRKLASSTVDYFNRWALLAKLLSHFPIWSDDDET